MTTHMVESRPSGGSPTGSPGASHATRPNTVLPFPPAGMRQARRPTGEPSGSSLLSSDIRETAAAGFLCLCAVALGCVLGVAIFSVSFIFERESVPQLIQYQRR